MSDTQIQRGQQWLESFMALAKLPASIHSDPQMVQADESCWLTIDSSHLTSAQVEILTGEHGEVLDSIQYLVNTILNLSLPEDQRSPYTVELDGYRARRQAELEAIAEQAVQTVRETGKEYEMTSLSSAERRQVHTLLKDFEDLETFSRGQEPDRRLVVRPLQPQGLD